MELTLLHDPANGPMQVGGLMSGSGTNLLELLRLEKRLKEERKGNSPFEVAVLFSNKRKGKPATVIRELSKTFGDIPYHITSYKLFKDEREGQDGEDIRREYDAKTADILHGHGVQTVALGGYMLIASEMLHDVDKGGFLCINVHPADLSIEVDGKRKYTGARAVYDAILAGETQLRSTTHILNEIVDGGPRTMISRPLNVAVPESMDLDPIEEIAVRICDERQDELKKVGDWDIFPRTIQYIAEGRYARSKSGALYFDRQPIPKGVRVEHLSSPN